MRVYAGRDVLTGQKLYLEQVVPAGPSVRAEAERARAELLRQVDEGRAPRTEAPLRVLLEKHFEVVEVERRTRTSLLGYATKHVLPFLGDVPVNMLRAELLGRVRRGAAALP